MFVLGDTEKCVLYETLMQSLDSAFLSALKAIADFVFCFLSQKLTWLASYIHKTDTSLAN